MEETAEMAGLFAAHAVWCVSDGSTLVPILALQRRDGSREMRRMVTDQVEDAVARGQEWLAGNPESVSSAVLIYDGYITLESGKTDALLIEARVFDPQPQSLTMAVPYRHAEDPAGFAVHRPKFLGFDGPEPNFGAVGVAFFRGVEEHEQGARVWEEFLDESR